MKVATEKALHFDASRERVWDAMADVEAYPRWWPWLEKFEASGLVAGDEWRCRVKPPLPYTVSFTIAFDEVVVHESISVRVTGEVAGPARLVLSDGTDGSTTVLVTSLLEPRSMFLRVLSTTLPPVARFGHDWIISTGGDQFAKRALAQT